MNQVKKIYCRIFQKAFHLVIPILPYRQPKKVEHLADIPSVLKEKGIDRILIVTDQGIRSHGLLEPLEKALRENHIFYEIYDKTVANPTTDNVEEARELYLSKECQALIGFGGGSSMDCAKGVGARIARPGKSLGQMAGILKVMWGTSMRWHIPWEGSIMSPTVLPMQFCCPMYWKLTGRTLMRSFTALPWQRGSLTGKPRQNRRQQILYRLLRT